MNKIFIRDYYLNQLQGVIGNHDVIKILLGMRRTGKSTILRMVRNQLLHTHSQSEIIYINKEDVAWIDVTGYKQLLDVVQNYPIIMIDEIQDIEDWQIAIRHLQASGIHDIYLSGSNAKLLGGEMATYLAGRYMSVLVYPLSYQEYTEYVGGSIDQYRDIGGLPGVWGIADPASRLQYLSDITQSIVYRDIVDRHNLRNTSLLDRLLVFLAHHIGDRFSAKSITNYLKSQDYHTNASTIIDYLGYCQQAYIIQESPRMDIRSKKIFETNSKYYFTDIGIRNSIVGGYNPLDLNGIMENLIYNHLTQLGRRCMVGQLDDKEIDFVCTRGQDKMYLQVTVTLSSQDVIDREYGNLEQIRDARPKYVIGNDQSGGVRNGIQYLSLVEFFESVR